MNLGLWFIGGVVVGQLLVLVGMVVRELWEQRAWNKRYYAQQAEKEGRGR